MRDKLLHSSNLTQQENPSLSGILTPCQEISYNHLNIQDFIPEELSFNSSFTSTDQLPNVEETIDDLEIFLNQIT